jgi:LacI family transcriptional regulator
VKQLAQLCGVSTATISRALNGLPGVGTETRERVLRLAAELDYVPSAAARTLVTKRSHLLGVVLDTGEGHPDLQHPFFQEALAGFKRHASDEGFDLMLFSSSRGAAHTRSLLSRCRQHHVDGLVLVAVDSSSDELAKVESADLPCVALDIDFAGVRTAHVASDNVGGAALAVRHLHSLGHMQIGTISIPQRRKPGRERLSGYRQELERLGLPFRAEYVVEGDEYYESGIVAMSRLLELTDPPTGVFVATDLMAAGALRGALEAGARVPDAVSIVGFDDIPLASLTHPLLTTIRQNAFGLGTAAARALIDLLNDPEAEPTSTVLPVELIVRGTSGGRSAVAA